MSKCLTITAVKNFKLSDSTSEILYGSLHGSPFLIIIIASRKQKLWVCICLNSTLIACRIVLSPNITWTYKLVQRRVIDVLRLVNAILKGLVIGCSGSNMGHRHYAFKKNFELICGYYFQTRHKKFGHYFGAAIIGVWALLEPQQYSKFVQGFSFQCLCAHSSIVSDVGIKMICTAITNLITLLYFLNHEME